MPPSSDSSIEIEPLLCEYCFQDLNYLTISERQEHYEDHFTDETSLQNQAESQATRPTPIATSSALPANNQSNDSSFSSTLGENPKKKFGWMRETDVFWYPEQTTAPPASFTPGFIHLLRKGLLKGHSRQLIRRAVLCHEKAVHVKVDTWDSGWGCGYRNFLMSCAVLMSQTQQPLYFPLLDSPLPPGIRNLQRCIEDAWKSGFDIEGQKQLKTLVGTHKWLGTADLWVAFTFRGIPAKLVDFDLANDPKGSGLLIDWVVDYFTQGTAPRPVNVFESLMVSPVQITEKMPLILQHAGHSRTIVGYEVDKKGTTTLLTFDPSMRPQSDLRSAALKEFAQYRPSGQYASPTSGSDSSGLKRKVSDDDIVIVGTKNLRTMESSSMKGRSSSSKVLSHIISKPEPSDKEPDLYAMTRKFRLDLKNLSKKKQYQILYFPMTAPLTDYEKNQQKTTIQSRRIESAESWHTVS